MKHGSNHTASAYRNLKAPPIYRNTVIKKDQFAVVATKAYNTERNHDDTELTFKYISGLTLPLIEVGNAIPAKFQKMGVSELSNLKAEIRVASTTSEI